MRCLPSTSQRSAFGTEVVTRSTAQSTRRSAKKPAAQSTSMLAGGVRTTQPRFARALAFSLRPWGAPGPSNATVRSGARLVDLGADPLLFARLGPLRPVAFRLPVGASSAPTS